MLKKRLILQIAVLLLGCSSTIAGDYERYYQGLPTEVARVVPVDIPANTVSITDFGGVGDGIALNTAAFSKAISTMAKKGGGRLTVPAGIWLTGPIALKDNIDFHLEKNAVVYFSPNKLLYVAEREEKGRVLPCIRASKCTNIAITGKGIIDGNGSQWRPVKRDKQSSVEWKQYLSMGGQVIDDGNLWFPWQMNNGYPDIADTPLQQESMRNDLVRLTDCVNVLIEGVTFQNSPRFHVHPCNCRNVIVDGITVRCPWNAQNGDGIDFSDVNVGLIVNNVVDVGDDGICMKSCAHKQNAPANGCEDIVVQNNMVYHAHGGFVLGSNTTSGIRRMVVRQNSFCGTDTGLRFKSAMGRGGKTGQIYISDIVMTDIKDEAIIFQCDYTDKPAGGKKKSSNQEEKDSRIPDFQDIHIERVTCHGCSTGIKAKGIAGLNCVHDIGVTDCSIVYRQNATLIDEETAALKLQQVKLKKDHRESIQ